MNRCALRLIASCILLNTILCTKQDPEALKTAVPRDKLVLALESRIPGLMEQAMIPGLSMAVIRDARLLWLGSFGVKDTESQEPVTEETIFEAASLSKPVFAYAVMTLVEKDRIDLDTPLMDYVSDEAVQENFLYNPITDERIRKITARMVLSHTPGFPNWRRQGNLTINFEPGDRFSYSGEGFGFLQRVVEQLTEKPLNAFMQETVFDPLGMTSSSYEWREDYDALAASPHNLMGEPGQKRKPRRAHAAASLHTTAADYARFLAAMLSPAGIQPETAEAMLMPQVDVEPDNDLAVHWGLGWGLENTRYGPALWHWGDNGDFKCFTLAFPEAKTGIVIFANGANGLGIVEEVVIQAVGGVHPAFRSRIMSEYARFDSPDISFMKKIKDAGAGTAIREYRIDYGQNPEQSPKLNEGMVNRLGYFFLRTERVEDAIEIFKLNVDLYPESSNVYDSLGEAYMVHGETDLAIHNYEKSLDLDPNNTNAVDKLAELRRN